MKIQTAAGKLAAAIGFANQATDVYKAAKRFPILGAALIQSRNGAITITTNDLTVSATADCAAEILEPGAVAVPASKLAALTKGFAAEASVMIGVTEQLATVTCDKSRYRLPLWPTADYPAPASVHDGSCEFTLAAEDLKRLIDKTQFAISTQETRYYLNGIYLHTAGDAQTRVLRAVATDGHRLAQIDLPAPEGAVGMPGIIVPRKASIEISRLAKSGGNVTIRVGTPDGSIKTATLIEARAEALGLCSRLVDGTFPDYARVIPRASDNWIELDRAALLIALERLTAIAEIADTAGLEWNDRDRHVSLSLPREPGAASDELTAITSGGGAQIALSVRYLLEQLDVLGGERVRLDAGSGGRAVRITDPAEQEFLSLLMPQTVNFSQKAEAA